MKIDSVEYVFLPELKSCSAVRFAQPPHSAVVFSFAYFPFWSCPT